MEGKGSKRLQASIAHISFSFSQIARPPLFLLELREKQLDSVLCDILRCCNYFYNTKLIKIQMRSTKFYLCKAAFGMLKTKGIADSKGPPDEADSLGGY